MHLRPDSRLVFATTNQGKLAEARVLLAGLPLDLRYLPDLPPIPEPEETETTFAGNAALKAAYYARATGCWAIADDSGLEVVALGNRPGVYSARFGGVNLGYPERMDLILQGLAACPEAPRDARFVCAISLANPVGVIERSFSGICEGRIVEAPRGSNGFGYDPVFAPLGYDETFGELPDTVKNSMSHRGRALAVFRAYLLDSLASEA
jgi:XTP/dITP diphosphohydrolase